MMNAKRPPPDPRPQRSRTPDRGSTTGVHRHPPRIAASDSWRSLRDARVPPMDSVDDPLRRRRTTATKITQSDDRGVQFFVSPGVQFRMSFDSLIRSEAYGVVGDDPRSRTS